MAVDNKVAVALVLCLLGNALLSLSLYEEVVEEKHINFFILLQHLTLTLFRINKTKLTSKCVWLTCFVSLKKVFDVFFLKISFLSFSDVFLTLLWIWRVKKKRLHKRAIRKFCDIFLHVNEPVICNATHSVSFHVHSKSFIMKFFLCIYCNSIERMESECEVRRYKIGSWCSITNLWRNY